jgi:putative SOS response-associated peptidase YedK
MCGRIRSGPKTAAFYHKFSSKNAKKIKFLTEDIRTGENISPGGTLSVLSVNAENLAIANMIWGLIPSSNKSLIANPDHFLMFNCRVESASDKVSFKSLLRNGKRCVLCIDGFYEWKKEATGKQPYYISSRADVPLCIPGLFDECMIRGKLVGTFTLFTSEPSASFSTIHNRQPVFLSSDQVDEWLSSESCDVAGMLEMWQQIEFRDQSTADLQWHPVTKKMSSMSYQGEDCSLPVRVGPTIASYFSPGKRTSTAKTEEDRGDLEDDSSPAKRTVEVIDLSVDLTEEEHVSKKKRDSDQGDVEVEEHIHIQQHS